MISMAEWIMRKPAASALPAKCTGPFDFAQGKLFGALRLRVTIGFKLKANG